MGSYRYDKTGKYLGRSETDADRKRKAETARPFLYIIFPPLILFALLGWAFRNPGLFVRSVFAVVVVGGILAAVAALRGS